ncbi:hypothetical protein [Kibdelosporangium aridum]|nr:hypothetical protein [Kibdelosporangium aridum]
MSFVLSSPYADLLAESAHDGAEISARHQIGDVANQARWIAGA